LGEMSDARPQTVSVLGRADRGGDGGRRWLLLCFFGGNNRPAEQDVDMLDSSIDGQELVDRWAGFDPKFFFVAVHDRIGSGSGLDGFLGSLDRQGCELGNGLAQVVQSPSAAGEDAGHGSRMNNESPDGRRSPW
jgi:hypothetical protein